MAFATGAVATNNQQKNYAPTGAVYRSLTMWVIVFCIGAPPNGGAKFSLAQGNTLGNSVLTTIHEIRMDVATPRA